MLHPSVKLGHPLDKHSWLDTTIERHKSTGSPHKRHIHRFGIVSVTARVGVQGNGRGRGVSNGMVILFKAHQRLCLPSRWRGSWYSTIDRTLLSTPWTRRWSDISRIGSDSWKATQRLLQWVQLSWVLDSSLHWSFTHTQFIKYAVLAICCSKIRNLLPHTINYLVLIANHEMMI